MNIAITWDLFIIAFVVVVVAYNFIIGKGQSLKFILAAHVGILAADALGNLTAKYLVGSPFLRKLSAFVGLGAMDHLDLFVKIFALVGFLVLIVVKGGFTVYAGDRMKGIASLIMMSIFGFINATLLLSALFVFISGGSFVSVEAGNVSPQVFQFYQSSHFSKLLIAYQDIWFVLPAIVILLASFLSNPQVDDADNL